MKEESPILPYGKLKKLRTKKTESKYIAEKVEIEL